MRPVHRQRPLEGAALRPGYLHSQASRLARSSDVRPQEGKPASALWLSLAAQEGSSRGPVAR